MIFLSTLIALLVERFFYWTQLRYWRWFNQYQLMLSAKIHDWPPIIVLFVSILPPVLLVLLISVMLSFPLFLPIKILFATLILLYCFGPENLWAQSYLVINRIHKNNFSNAPNGVSQEGVSANYYFGVALNDNSQKTHTIFLRALFNASNQKIFAVIFWFAILGPAGAVLYRLIDLSCTGTSLPVQENAKRILNALDWIPARILTFFFALAGHFTQVIAIWKKLITGDLNSNQELLYQCGAAAIDAQSEKHVTEPGHDAKEALLLIDRSLVITLVILAIIVLLI